ncbi:hypothetical protein [Bradyrhizobium erythrophlei]|uniref:Uncharacterized protein n=1 Tax=Bradyrhizobium erythrophlei TaxID=1437360 RepID=A0A1M5MPC5_9BRAD|nr:hypothetical protein [Bradyrhizobium erythrophlei]SHG79106.1 hypothetical protein SAMN05443248_2666 [Bradyrhizobium erythrophlei]
MILYHFTRAERAEQILKHGLLPAGDRHNMLGGAEVVWLTEREVLRMSAAERKAVYERSGQILRSWLYSEMEDEVVRLSVRIPSHDRRLERYMPWLRKHWRPGMPNPYDSFWRRNVMEAHWIYDGEIAPSSICAVDKDRSCFSQAEALTDDLAVSV